MGTLTRLRGQGGSPATGPPGAQARPASCRSPLYTPPPPLSNFLPRPPLHVLVGPGGSTAFPSMRTVRAPGHVSHKRVVCCCRALLHHIISSMPCTHHAALRTQEQQPQQAQLQPHSLLRQQLQPPQQQQAQAQVAALPARMHACTHARSTYVRTQLQAHTHA